MEKIYCHTVLIICTMDLFTTLLISLLFAILIKWWIKSDPPKINGVYSQPNKWYWLKYAAFRLILWLRKRQQNRTVSGKSAGLGRKSRNSPEEMDRIQVLPDEHPTAVDAVYITGSNREGQFLVTATARRHNNLVQTILFLRLPGIGLFEFPSMPDTSLEGTGKDEYAADGLKIEVVEPMKKWRIRFDGKLRLRSTGKLYPVKFDFDWSACSGFFDFDTDMHPALLADSIAREPWSREFFQTLQKIHQTHYEQFGDTRGVVHIEGMEEVKVDIRGVRDHSYGNHRDWNQLHRYCLQYVSIEDGTTLCFGAVSMPVTTSRLPIGYVFLPNGHMDPVSWCDFEFYKLGDDGNPPSEFTMNFIAGDYFYKLEGSVIEAPIFYIGECRDAKIHERLCNYKLNGIPGWGLSEWEYKNTDGTKPKDWKNVLD